MLTGREEGDLELAALDLDRLNELKGFFKSPVRVSAADLFRRSCCGLFPAIKPIIRLNCDVHSHQ